ncbi:conserved hypothetical protein [Histoplasma capsulatum G186AR]|uniref:LysM domain-containing protein n=1 Tax=Ajellomyces capsulatus (strain G186AR / H82 / ATCC MYA-2454 / RMSCC 2432) TaxID=447093 RepID=C0NVI7_AJECG|nr:uncharacterized protein HCBG_07167 [Histoplasma capsulatum G186AR]EEH04526.1 conserved hypothetical protein [Histoplasma capsulatum G186AR]
MTSNTNKSDVFNSSTASANSSSGVRPRNRRLISLADDDDDDILGTTANDHVLSSNSLLTPSAPRSRACTPSPTPSRHPSRPPTASSTTQRLSNGARLENGSTDIRQTKPASPFVTDFLESSWVSLQGLASSVLGNEDIFGKADRSTSVPGGHQRRRRKSPGASFVRDSGSGHSSWGPASFLSKQLGSSGSNAREARQSTVETLKRQALLEANGDVTPDSQGNYKRRDSGDAPRGYSTPPAEQDDSDALVYVHHVQPNDSITGVSIKYGCQPAVMRKSNGFWPSDSIQARKTVLIPVEACTLKGRRLPAKEDDVNLFEDLNTSTEDPYRDITSLATDSEASSAFGYEDLSLRDEYPGSATSSISSKTQKQEPLWKHECWVQIDGFPDAVEIGRVTRKTLGFFPRARRKSLAPLSTPYSDLDDIPPPLYQKQTQNTRTANASSSSINSSPFDSHLSPSSHTFDPSKPSLRSLSNPNIHRYRSSFTLLGHGGVGTLGPNVKVPGPAEDKLNQFVKTHLPQLALSPPQSSLQIPPSSNSYGRRTSVESTSTVVSNTSSTGLENVGGAIEGWMRKMARNAKAGVTEFQQQDGRLGIGGMGDLIELADTPDGKGTSSHVEPGVDTSSSTRDGTGSDLNFSPLLSSRSGSESESTIGLFTSRDGSNSSVRGRRKKGD